MTDPHGPDAGSDGADAGDDHDDPPSVHLRAGAAVHNAGRYHAAHDAWEPRWLALKRSVSDPAATVEQVDPDRRFDAASPAADERLLHGLIQFTAAAHHLLGDRDGPTPPVDPRSPDPPGDGAGTDGATTVAGDNDTDTDMNADAAGPDAATGQDGDSGSRAGAVGLARSGRAYLGGLPADYRSVNVDAVREWLAAVAAGPATAGRPPALLHDGTAVGYDDLGVPATAVAAGAVAEDLGYDPDPVARAGEYARSALAAGDRGDRFISLLVDFLRRPADRGVVYARLAEHVDRRRQRDESVDDLF